MFQRVNYGEITNEKNLRLADLSGREWAMMIPTVAMCIFMGVAPGVFLKPMEPSVLRTIDRINQVRLAAASPAAPAPAVRVGLTGGGGR